jgi:hypothetical protein
VLPTLRIDILHVVVIPLEFGRHCLCRRRAAVDILLILFRFVSFRFVSFRFVSFRFILFSYGLVVWDYNRGDNAHRILMPFWIVEPIV